MTDLDPETCILVHDVWKDRAWESRVAMADAYPAN